MTSTSQQAATVGGSGHTVVQIVGEGNAVTLEGAAALRLRAYREAIFADAPASPTRRGEPGYTTTGRRETRLLSPYNTQSLPLQGRTSALGALQDWLNASGFLSIHSLIGSGGRGKTRLAVELADWARGRGWTTGFARRDDLDVFLGGGCRTRWEAPTLVVVDYAAAKAGAIASWLRHLVHDAEYARSDEPLRLLLLERAGEEAAAWWREVFGGADLETEAVRECLAPGAPLTLGPLTSPDERHAVFAAAFAQASEATTVPSRSVSLDDALARASLGGEPLFLAMFGLIAARQGVAAAQTLPADRIALDLAGQELARVGRVWEAHNLEVGRDRPLHAHLAAVAALCEGLDETRAHAAIAREFSALNQAIAAGTTEQARAALHAALPGEDRGIAAIQPDILGEAAMILAWKALPDSGVETVRRAMADPARRGAVRRSVVRTCQDFLIRGERLPLAWLEALRADADTGDLKSLLDLVRAMPTATLELRETALALTERIVQVARALPDGEERNVLLSTTLNNLSTRLSDLDQREAALAASEETVAIQRGLAAARPNAFLSDLASSLANLSTHLSGLGRREEALVAIQDAVAIQRRLVGARPNDFLSYLAGSLSNLSRRLFDLGQREEALAASEEAVTIQRSLAATRPNDFLPNLAAVINNLSSYLSNLGRREEALVVIEEAVAIWRGLAAERPDAFLPNLAITLNNLSNRRANLGQKEAALAAIEEAVVVRRDLAAARPNAFLPDLAQSLNNLSLHLSNLGRREAALAAIEEAVAIRRDLAEARPDAFLPNLATSCGARGQILLEVNPAAAAASFAEGITALCAPFLSLPMAFGLPMRALCHDYMEACEAAGAEQDMDLLAPILATLQQLPGPENGNG